MNMDHKPVFFGRYIPIMLIIILSICLLITDTKITSAQDEKGIEKIIQKKESHEIIIIDNKGYKTDRKGPSRFEHVKHARDYKISCWECHHDFKNDVNVWSPWEENKKCSECHDPVEKIEGKPRLQAAYHKNCKSCHKERKIFKNDTLAYRKCTVCHDNAPK